MPLLRFFFGVRRYNLNRIAAWKQSEERWRGYFGKAIRSFWRQRTKPDYIDLLWEILETEEDLAPLIVKYALDKPVLRDAFNELSDGCDVVVHGHYVAASALVFPQTLDMTMSAMRTADQKTDRTRVAEVKIRLVHIFERGI